MDLQNVFDKLMSFLSKDWKLMLFLTTAFALYYYYTATFDYFKKKGIPYTKPVIFLGNIGSWLKSGKAYQHYQVDIYNFFKGERLGGVFHGRQPILYILDPELIKAVTIRDFDHFVDRNSLITKEPRYLKRTLLNLTGPVWKGVRNTITPVFSSARLKNMFPIIELCSMKMVKYINQYDQKEIELNEAMGHFTMEVIGACTFGIKTDALSNRDSHFIKVAKKIDYMSTFKRIMLCVFLIFMPKLFRLINFSLFNTESTDELVRILQAVKAERKLKSSKNNDLLQILLDIANKEQTETNKEILKYMDDDTIDAQCLLFLIAGYDTSSTLLSFAIHVLATKPELQNKLRAHIMDMTEGKELTYELIADLEFLDAFLLETLRMYPPNGIIHRLVTKPYTIPDSNVQLDVGDVIAISIYGIHMDPDFYPDPEEFRPERFMGEEKKNRPSHLFLAFGAGPRNCIGLRFVMISAKLAILSLIKSFKFATCSKTEDPISFDNKCVVLLKPKNGLWVHVEKLK